MIPSPPPTTDHERERNRLFRALSVQRRRFTLRVLSQNQETNLSEIAREIATRENDRSTGDVPSDVITDVQIDLYHRHIPVLAEAGLVHYVEEPNVVAISEYGTDVTVCLEEGAPVPGASGT